MKYHTHCQRTADKAKIVFLSYRSIARANWGVGHKQFAQLYNTTFVPRITYVAGAWWSYATQRVIRNWCLHSERH